MLDYFLNTIMWCSFFMWRLFFNTILWRLFLPNIEEGAAVVSVVCMCQYAEQQQILIRSCRPHFMALIKRHQMSICPLVPWEVLHMLKRVLSHKLKRTNYFIPVPKILCDRVFLGPAGLFVTRPILLWQYKVSLILENLLDGI